MEGGAEEEDELLSVGICTYKVGRKEKKLEGAGSKGIADSGKGEKNRQIDSQTDGQEDTKATKQTAGKRTECK